MSNGLDVLQHRFTALAEYIQTLAFIPRDGALQTDALVQSARFAAELEVRKLAAVEAQDEKSANEVLFMQLALRAITSQLQMCVSLKQDAGEVAWGALVDAQNACGSAIGIRKQIDFGPPMEHLENLRDWLLQLELLVFPPQSFMSAGGTVSRRECSICGDSYEACGHVKGRAYMGRLCHTIIKEIRLAEVSLVDNPANKMARVTHVSDGEGRRNKMTWRLEDEPQSPAT